jgi:hypothetical protein
MSSQRHVAVIENVVVEAERPIVPTCYVFEGCCAPRVAGMWREQAEALLRPSVADQPRRCSAKNARTSAYAASAALVS